MKADLRAVGHYNQLEGVNAAQTTHCSEPLYERTATLCIHYEREIQGLFRLVVGVLINRWLLKMSRACCQLARPEDYATRNPNLKSGFDYINSNIPYRTFGLKLVADWFI